jgi:hypothetical protein
MKALDQIGLGGVQPLAGFAPADTGGAHDDAPFALPAHLSHADMVPLADSMDIERAQRLARRTDPDTSLAAAARAKRFAPKHAAAITGVLWRPMIPPEIAKFTGLTVVQIDRRRHELIVSGQVRLTGRERDGFQQWERIDAAFTANDQGDRT